MATYYGQNKVDVGIYIETDRLVLSADEYAAIPVKDPNTMYLVYDDPVLVDIMRHMEDDTKHLTIEDVNTAIESAIGTAIGGSY